MKIESKFRGVDSATLHILAMGLMLCDHICMTLAGNMKVLHYVGRIAFPIFAFMLVEGFKHTSNIKKYVLRLVIVACIAEIPFDLMCGGVWFFLTQQNTLFTLILALLAMLLMEQPKKLKKPWVKYVVFSVTVLFTLLLAFLVGNLTMVDYFGGGIVMVIVFYLFRGEEILSFTVSYPKEWMRITVIWGNRLLQAIFIWNICCEMLGGLCENITVFGKTYEVVVESFGILALLPIWLYNGQKGSKSKTFQYICYAFYPAHIIVLLILQRLI